MKKLQSNLLGSEHRSGTRSWQGALACGDLGWVTPEAWGTGDCGEGGEDGEGGLLFLHISAIVLVKKFGRSRFDPQSHYLECLPRRSFAGQSFVDSCIILYHLVSRKAPACCQEELRATVPQMASCVKCMHVKWACVVALLCAPTWLPFFPTCQVRVVRFYVSCLLLSSSPLLLLLLNRDPRSQCSLSDLNHDHPRPVFPAGPQPRPSPPSVPCRTSTTTIHAQCSLPDLNREYPRQVFPAGPQPRPSTPSVPCRTSTASIHAKCSLPDLM